MKWLYMCFFNFGIELGRIVYFRFIKCVYRHNDNLRIVFKDIFDIQPYVMIHWNAKLCAGCLASIISNTWNFCYSYKIISMYIKRSAFREESTRSRKLQYTSKMNRIFLKEKRNKQYPGGSLYIFCKICYLLFLESKTFAILLDQV